ncbi:DHHC palmitoyltransferase-domain-containing protein [Pelagophyceae sp. CCMP2097]|nr:DHHC palmitoyltransferase-domain-containing protein [Pelagophyceae sp. CCMP2097]
MAAAGQITCWHCRTVFVVPHPSSYWRCGKCRRVNGRPESARGCLGGLEFYSSRVAHGFATALLLIIIGSGLGVALPTATRSYGATAFATAWAASLTLSACAVSAFFVAARRPAGAVPRMPRLEWARQLGALRRDKAPEDEALDVLAATLPWCALCDNLKPPRVHHCQSCSACVHEMDHHCVFLHNCVGRDNRADFIRLLAAVAAGTWYVTIYAGFEVYLAFRVREDSDLGGRAMRRAIGDPPRITPSFSWRYVGTLRYVWATLCYSASSRDGRFLLLAALALGVALGVTGLAAFQCYLAATGETTLERIGRQTRGGADHRTHPGLRHLFRPRGRRDAAAVTTALLEPLLESTRRGPALKKDI